jgi:hypothetical protein
MKTVTISGREYLVVQATSYLSSDGRLANCNGCALDAEKTGKACSFVVKQLPYEDQCFNNIIYILNTPEEIAAYAAERLK